MVLMSESAEDLLPADPELGEVDWFRRVGVGLSWGELSEGTVRPGIVIVQQVFGPDHPFFVGTEVTSGDVSGAEGRNGGGAYGWEADTAIDFGEGNGAAPPGEQVLGHGSWSPALAAPNT
jgi:hypothetical protein